MKIMIATFAASLAVLAAPLAEAYAYTEGGDVLISILVDEGCETAEWPTGARNTKCGEYQTYQRNVEPGDVFGVRVHSESSWVGCSVTDVESGEELVLKTAKAGGTANCMLEAK